MAEPTTAKAQMSPEASALSPPMKVPNGARGYLLTLQEQNAWWKVNTSLEAIALIRSAWADLNGDVEAPPLEPHAVENAPGALFVAQGASPAGAKKDDPADIAHRILERVRDDKHAAALGAHLMRVLPVEDTCAIDNAQVEAMAKKLADKHLPESASAIEFAVRPEPHSPQLKTDMSVGDLVRRTADQVSKKHTVNLTAPRSKTMLLMLVGDSAMLSCVEDWHQLHKFNVHVERQEAKA